MNERVLVALADKMDLRVGLHRNPTTRTIDLEVSQRPRCYRTLKTFSDDALGGVDELDTLLRASEIIRGAIIHDASQERFSLGPGYVSEHLQEAVLQALDRRMTPAMAHSLGLRLVDIVTKHADSETCERLSLALMEHVERLRR